jgi:hypothetical protein
VPTMMEMIKMIMIKIEKKIMVLYKIVVVIE